MVLSREDDIKVVAEAGTGLEAIEATRTHRPIGRFTRDLAGDVVLAISRRRLTHREQGVLVALARGLSTPRSVRSCSSGPRP